MLLSVSIEFGSTRTGYAFSFKSDHLTVRFGNFPKEPSCVLMSPNGNSMHSFGYAAKEYYMELIEKGESKDWYFFTNWMNTQYGCTGLGYNSFLVDVNGKTLATKTVLSEYIKGLKDSKFDIKTGETCLKQHEIAWVFSIPDIWDDAAIESLKNVAQLQIPGKNISIIRRSVAAFEYIRLLDKKWNFTKEGTKFSVLHAGGNTVILTDYEVMKNGDVQELNNMTLSGSGGNCITKNIENFIDRLCGKPVMERLKNKDEREYQNFIQDIELKWRTTSRVGFANLCIPGGLFEVVEELTSSSLTQIVAKSKHAGEINIVRNKMRIDVDVFCHLLSTTVENILHFVKFRMEDSKKSCSSALVLTGGLAELPLLQEAIKSSFPATYVSIADEAALVTLKGAVSYGHRKCKPEPLMAAAIDFGTVYSGWAYSFKSDFESDPIKVSSRMWNLGTGLSQKAPTCLLIERDGKTVHSFGSRAESKYSELAEENQHKQWFFFKQFKLVLYGRIGLERNIMLEDATGKKLPAATVFSLAIKYLKDDLLSESKKRILDENITDEEIQWVLTVPAIWNDAAKQFMREAAQKAGIPGDQLKIALEPEVASIFCRLLPVDKHRGKSAASLATFKEGTKYIVLDAGGGTIDITAHQIMSNGNIRELQKATGGDWGGTKVDYAFEEFLRKICGTKAVAKLKEKYMEDYIELFRSFEIKKRETHLNQDTTVIIHIPAVLSELVKKYTGNTIQAMIMKTNYKDQVKLKKDKIKLNMTVMKSFFQDSVMMILDQVEKLLKERNVSDCSAIVMVGGYSEAPILQASVEERFSNLKIIIPEESGLVVLKGAVIYGHKPETMAERVCKFTYGEKTTHISSELCKHPKGNSQRLDENGQMRCYEIFDIYVQIGQTIAVGEETKEHIYTPVYDDQTAIDIDVYASSNPTPYFVTDEGCRTIGGFEVPIVDTSFGRNREIGVSFKFGGTEIEVKVTDKVTGETTKRFVNFLE